ncbi:hypothetical protein [Janibacter sp. YB324]|uniref:hypothetical protein n=1 Tax=Janibacter sp. YB324 TaxID=2761047 RepID=UPI001628FCD7|nr:hypothetical protein [Janibacter sp. YB324]QNF94325.1 hypothetical protein H7A72_00290 [Janibacter sp. YB324]
MTEAARYLRRMIFTPSATDVVDALSHRYFEPNQDWKLFEIAILLRITTALNDVGVRTSPIRLFNDTKARPFAVYQLTPTRQVRIWYQKWPPTTRPSELNDAIRHYELPSGGTRPDIVVETVIGGETKSAVLLELKASSSGAYLSSGLSQLLGYMRDRPALFANEASGWLVAPPSPNFVSKNHEGRSLWVTSAEDVGAAIVARVFPGSTDQQPLSLHRQAGRTLGSGDDS